MKLIELLRVIDDSEHKNEVWIGVRHSDLDMRVGSAFGVLGDFCATNKLRTDVVENAEVLGIDTDLSCWSFGGDHDPDESNTHSIGFDVKPQLVIWISPEGLE